jgi:hypothetical protein
MRERDEFVEDLDRGRWSLWRLEIDGGCQVVMSVVWVDQAPLHCQINSQFEHARC